jgi:hypothetical protein
MKHHRPVSTLPAPSANPNLSINNLPNLTQPPVLFRPYLCPLDSQRLTPANHEKLWSV